MAIAEQTRSWPAACVSDTALSSDISHNPHMEKRHNEMARVTLGMEGTRAGTGGGGNGAGHCALASLLCRLGKSLPIAFAAKRKCASREAGMPIVRQLWTVETGASINFATAEVPPR